MSNEFTAALTDFGESIKLAPLWWRLGVDQTLARFRRTLLGPVWLATGMLATSFALTLVYGSLFHTDYHKTFPFIITGILAWFVISGAVMEATTAFIASASLMQIQRLPLGFYIFLHMQKVFVGFVIQLIAFFVCVAVLGVAVIPHWNLIIAIPLLLLFLYFVSYVIAVAATRFRDVGHMAGFVIQLLFFLTPILWHITQLSPQVRQYIALNPLWHAVELIRQPLLGQPVDAEHWIWVGGVTVVAAFVTLYLVAAFRRRVVFWL